MRWSRGRAFGDGVGVCMRRAEWRGGVLVAVGMDGHATSNTSGSGSAGASTATGGTSTSSVTSAILAISSDAAVLQVGFRCIRSCF